VQEAINEFVQAYGRIEKPFDSNLFSTGSVLGLALNEFENKPNSKQLGLVHCCLGKARRF
jgi:hypothetical protein